MNLPAHQLSMTVLMTPDTLIQPREISSTTSA